MKDREERKRIVRCWFGVLILALMLIAAGCAKSKTTNTEQPKLKVVTTSTDIADVVKEIGGDKVQVENIVPPGQCPGHFDANPQSIKVLGDANLFLLHDYDSQMKFPDKLVGSVGNTKLEKASIGENQQTLMVPARRLKGIDQIADALAKSDPQNADAYKAAAVKLKDSTTQFGQEQKKRLDDAGAGQLKVLVAGYQAEFAQWAGLNVVGVFPPDISANDTKKLIDQGRQKGASLVVDNLQTPNKAAAVGITEELKVPEVALSNFPGGLPGTETWSDSFKKNVDLILEQCKK